ncbi:MAG: DegV family protein [Caldilineales bacterium]|nr:DegV family protein [Caldilineales bacterium]MDW8318110.1 DegV family protein [Anaerolineae bacterium]
MARVAVVTDSNAFLPPQVVERLNIHVLPHTIYLEQGSFKEGVNLTPGQYFRLLAQSSDSFLPRASGPGPEAFFDLYSHLYRTTDQILSLHMSGHLSDAVQNARTARQMLLGRCQIEVIDTQTATMGLGLLVQAAATAARSGYGLADCVRLVRGMMPHIYLFFLVRRLAYLERERRISPAQALLGHMLRVMPLLQVEDGEIIPLEKVRSSQRGIDKLFDYVSEFAQIEQAIVLQHGFDAETAELTQRFKMAFPHKKFPVMSINPSLAVHIGPEALGVVVFERIT